MIFQSEKFFLRIADFRAEFFRFDRSAFQAQFFLFRKIGIKRVEIRTAKVQRVLSVEIQKRVFIR